MWKAAILTFILLGQVPCNYFKEQKVRQEKIENELILICDKLPLPDNFTQPQVSADVDPGISLNHRHNSFSSCGDIYNHFGNHFAKMGWSASRFREGYQFADGEYSVSIYCLGPSLLDERSDVSITCSWNPK